MSRAEIINNILWSSAIGLILGVVIRVIRMK